MVEHRADWLGVVRRWNCNEVLGGATAMSGVDMTGYGTAMLGEEWRRIAMEKQSYGRLWHCMASRSSAMRGRRIALIGVAKA